MSDMAQGILIGASVSILSRWAWLALREWRNRPKKQREQSTYCWCQVCGNELASSGSFFEDTDLVRYVCSTCGLISEWLFDAPAPLLINSFRLPALRSQEV